MNRADRPLFPVLPGRRVVGLVATSALVLGLAGCAMFGSDDAAAPRATTTSSTTSTTAAPIARTAPPELLDAGDEPRQALRVAYTEGDEAEITFTSDLQVAQDSEGRTQRLDSPPITQTLAYEVGPVTGQGAELTVRIEAIAVKAKGTGLSADAVTALDDELAPLVGLETTGTVTPLGEVEGLAFEAPEDLPAALATRLSSLEAQLPALGPALPAEPVGVGASWRTTTTSAAGGAQVETVSTITLTKIDDGTIQYTSAIRTSAEPQDLDLAGLPKGTTAHLESSDQQGTATGTMGLDHVELGLRTHLSGSQQLTLHAAGGTTELTQAIELAYVAVTAPA